jgi:hypothetical protein
MTTDRAALNADAALALARRERDEAAAERDHYSTEAARLDADVAMLQGKLDDEYILRRQTEGDLAALKAETVAAIDAWMTRAERAEKALEMIYALPSDLAGDAWSIALDALRKVRPANPEGSETPEHLRSRLPSYYTAERTCPCGFDNEPWHFPRNGMCSIGATMRVKKGG